MTLMGCSLRHKLAPAGRCIVGEKLTRMKAPTKAPTRLDADAGPTRMKAPTRMRGFWCWIRMTRIFRMTRMSRMCLFRRGGD